MKLLVTSPSNLAAPAAHAMTPAAQVRALLQPLFPVASARFLSRARAVLAPRVLSREIARPARAARTRTPSAVPASAPARLAIASAHGLQHTSPCNACALLLALTLAAVSLVCVCSQPVRRGRAVLVRCAVQPGELLPRYQSPLGILYSRSC